MARSPSPIRPRRLDERAYERVLRTTYINPFFNQLRGRLANAEAATQAWRAMDQTVMAMTALPKNGVPVHMIQAALDKMKGYHRKRVIDSFRAALGLDITRVLSEPEISAFMAHKLSENVDLIKTIPIRVHAGLKARLALELQRAPFDQQVLTQMVRKEYGSTGYNLRRIVRDQTSKTVAGLTEIRQRQLGIDGYEWLTSQDERVRPSHIANSGQFFLWSKPPSRTGPPGQDIQCRCVAIPVVLNEDRDRLKERSGPTSSIETPSPGGPGPKARRRQQRAAAARLPVPPAPQPAPAPARSPAPAPAPAQGGMFEQAAAPPTDARLRRLEKIHDDGMQTHKDLTQGRPALRYGTREYYGKGTYGGTNEKLRGLDTRDARAVSEQRIKRTLDDLREDALPLERDMTLYRGEYRTTPPMAGTTFDRAPWSTSTTPGPALKFSRGADKSRQVVYQIEAPKGTRAVVGNPSEAEVTFLPGQKFEVVATRRGHWYYDDATTMVLLRAVE